VTATKKEEKKQKCLICVRRVIKIENSPNFPRFSQIQKFEIVPEDRLIAIYYLRQRVHGSSNNGTLGSEFDDWSEHNRAPICTSYIVNDQANSMPNSLCVRQITDMCTYMINGDYQLLLSIQLKLLIMITLILNCCKILVIEHRSAVSNLIDDGMYSHINRNLWLTNILNSILTIELYLFILFYLILSTGIIYQAF